MAYGRSALHGAARPAPPPLATAPTRYISGARVPVVSTVFDQCFSPTIMYKITPHQYNLFQLIVLAAALAVANAGLLAAPAYAPAAYHAAPAYAPLASTAVGSTAQSTVRSLDGNSVVSQYSKAVDTAFSSVRKYDTRVSNDGVAIAPAYHAPAAYAPAAYAAPAYAAPAYAPRAYAAPVAAVAAPAYAPRAYAAPVAAHGGLLGVAYSAAPAVTHLSFDGYGVHYGY
ncbi:cuticle protein 76-like [Homalodisca vitripennis]|uniref:cuticle protein 76-like n=1 Tax=Homalodisca vitripennis TaxID=197043 RepID=UPI001EEA6B40|nr:cuticle protein 76-like [Homalodisca vitripennis]